MRMYWIEFTAYVVLLALVLGLVTVIGLWLLKGNRMKRLLIMLVLAGMLIGAGGCGGKFVKYGVTAEQAARDFAECKYEAAKASYTPMGRFDSPFMAGIQEGMQFNRVMRLCMEAKGYHIEK